MPVLLGTTSVGFPNAVRAYYGTTLVWQAPPATAGTWAGTWADPWAPPTTAAPATTTGTYDTASYDTATY